jgi:hypothetical protein
MIDERREDRTPDEWSPAERAAFARLAEAHPPAELENAVLSALRARDLLVPDAPGDRAVRSPLEPRVPAGRVWAWAGLALAACIAAFYAGLSVRERGAGVTAADSTTGAVPVASSRYLLLLYEDEAYRAPETPAEVEARVAEYSAWAAEVDARGIAIQGDELAAPVESWTLDGSRGAVVETRGAPAAAAGTIAGYFVVEGVDAGAAVAIARTMPHLEYGGTVVVRPIVAR